MQRTLCTMHHTRLVRSGSVGEAEPRHIKGLPLFERLAQSFRPERMPNGCLEATAGRRDKDGYPILTYERRDLRGGRAALFAARRWPSFDGAQACHTCDNRLCLDTDHLYWGTTQDNTADRVARGRSGGRPMAGDIDEARRLYGEGVPLRQIERRTGISRTTIKRHLGLPMPPAFAKVLAKGDPRRIEVPA